VPLTPEERRRIYEEEKAREDARLLASHRRQYGGFFGKMFLGVTVFLNGLIIVLGLLVLVVVAWLIWAVSGPHK